MPIRRRRSFQAKARLDPSSPRAIAAAPASQTARRVSMTVKCFSGAVSAFFAAGAVGGTTWGLTVSRPGPAGSAPPAARPEG